MEHLSLAGNEIEDIGSLARMPNLQQLTLSGNQVTDITPLLNLNNLTSVYLTGNELNEMAYQEGLSMMVERNPRLSLRYDPNPCSPEEVAGTLEGSLGGVRLQWSAVANGPMYTSYYQVSRFFCYVFTCRH